MNKVFCQTCKRMVPSGPYCDNCGASFHNYTSQQQTGTPAPWQQSHPPAHQQRNKKPLPFGYKILGVCFGLIVLFAIIGGLIDKQKPVPVATPSNTTPETATAPRTNQPTELDQERTQYMRRFFYEGFGGAGNPKFAASWYKNIKQMTVIGDTATVIVDLPADSDGMRSARELCGMILGNSRGERIAVTTINMVDKSGKTLSSCIWTPSGPKIR